MKKLLAIFILAGALMLPASVGAETESIELVSLSDNGMQAVDSSFKSRLSNDGKRIAFLSKDPALTDTVGNTFANSYVRDIVTGTTEMVSVNSDGVAANNLVLEHDISGNGRYVAFVTRATNMGYGTTVKYRLYLRDLELETTSLISTSSTGVQANGVVESTVISDDGRYVAFYSNSNNLHPQAPIAGRTNVYIKDTQTGALHLASPGLDGEQQNNNIANRTYIDISADGRFVTFDSAATNITTDQLQSTINTFRFDRLTNTVDLVSVAQDGSNLNNDSLSGPISADGRMVLFTSRATNIEGPGDTSRSVYLKNMESGELTLLAESVRQASSSGFTRHLDISSDGSKAVWTEQFRGMWMYDVETKSSTQIAKGPNGDIGSVSSFPSVNADGSVVVFDTLWPFVVDNDTNGAEDVFRISFTTPDTTAPAVAGAPTTEPNENGWYQEPVTIQWSVEDEDPEVTTPEDTIANTEGTNTYTSGEACDTAGNCATGEIELSIDLSAPEVLFTGQQETYEATDTITITCDASDAVSPVVTTDCPEIIDQPAIDYVGENTLTATATDAAGNTTSTTIMFTVLEPDTTPPTVTGQADRSANENGWYNASVVIDWTAVDPEPSSGTASDPADTLAELEGTNTYTSEESCDAVNNCATGELELSIDTVAPTVSFTGQQATYNEDATIVITCEAADTTSGVDTATLDCPEISGPASDYIGSNTLTATATDLAGNTTTVEITFEVTENPDDIQSLIDEYVEDRRANRFLSRAARRVENANGVFQCYWRAYVFNYYVEVLSPRYLTEEEADTLAGLAYDLCG